MSYPNTTYPTTLDNPTLPAATDAVDTFDHAGLEDFQNNAIVALETKVGITSSSDNTSLDFKTKEITGGDTAVGKTATQTLSGKTLTTPTIASFVNATHNHQNAAGGGSLDAAAIGSGTVATARLGSGSATSSTYLRGDQTWQPITAGATATSLLPIPGMGSVSLTSSSIATATTMQVGLIFVPATITVNKLTFKIESFSSSGTMKIGLYSYDGSTQVISATSGTISGTGFQTITLGSPVVVSVGYYFVTCVAVSGSFNPDFWLIDTGLTQFTNVPSGKVILEGTLTVTSGTLPSTITPTSITYTQNRTLVIRLDN